MNGIDLTRPYDAARLLVGDDPSGPAGSAEPRAVLAERLGDADVGRTLTSGLGKAGRAAGGTVRDEVARAADGLLSLDLGDVLLMGWRKHAALRAAGVRTRADPTASEVVALATHHVSLDQALDVDVYVDAVKVTTLDFVLAVLFRLEGLAAVVRDGKLSDLRGGQCRATGSLTAKGVPLLHREATLTPGVLVRLGDGVSLVPEDTVDLRAAPAPRLP